VKPEARKGIESYWRAKRGEGGPWPFSFMLVLIIGMQAVEVPVGQCDP